MEYYDGFEVETTFDKENCWTVLTFYKEKDEIGFMNIDINRNSGFIFTMNSYKQKEGIGTKMIEFLINRLMLEKIDGDADPDSIGFWDSFNPKWSGESFTIYADSLTNN